MKLSFGIPTRNRAHIIGSALDSIISQATEDVEIVIVDGASTDHTQEVVQRYSKTFPRIKYFRRDKCVGVDLDIAKAVELASWGDYCWLMSDDDVLEDGAIVYVLEMLNRNPGLSGITINYSNYDKTMKFPVHTLPSSSGGVLNSDRLFYDCKECFSLIGLQISFISTQIVKQKLWQQIAGEYDLKPYIDEWLMSYIIGRMIQKEPRWLYIHRKCVRQRVNNDSFVERVGVYNRQIIAHVTYSQTIAGLFGKNSDVYKNIFRALASDRLPRTFAVIKSRGISFNLQFKLLILYTKIYWRYVAYWTKVIPLFFVPDFIYKIVHRLYFKWMAQKHLRSIKPNTMPQPCK